jgi:hypothetical protein
MGLQTKEATQSSPLRPYSRLLHSPSGGVYRNKPLPEGAVLKDGCFDAGIGYFDTRDDGIYSFGDNKFMREATEEEIEFFQSKASTSKNTSMGLPVEDEAKYDDDGGYSS